jgi:hypothetical protein
MARLRAEQSRARQIVRPSTSHFNWRYNEKV